MERHRRRRATAVATLAGAITVLLALPMFSSAGLLDDVQRGVQEGLDPVTKVITKRSPAKPDERTTKAPTAARQPAQTPGQGTYQPPLHGANPHGQGSVVVGDIQPSEDRPLAGDPTGDASGEEVVVGRSRGEQQGDGSYHGHITIVSLFGNEILGVDTNPGESKAGPLDPLQQGLLNPLCNASTICLSVLTADSETTSNGSSNRFAVANVRLGDPNAPAASVRAAESNGSISSDANCQTSHGDSTVADVDLGGAAVADVAQSSADSRACSDGTQAQQNDSSVIGLGGTGVPLPVAGCANGTPDSAFTPLTPLAAVVCNADDTSGNGEAAAQTAVPYGVREALSVFALEAGGTSLVKATTAASESHAVAPAGPVPPPEPKPECSDGVDNDGDGKVDFPADPGCDSREDNSERDRNTPPDSKPECSDGVDNDGDGEVDFPDDPGCDSRDDDSEDDSARDGKPECSDGVDNDGDGKVDFPADPNCDSRDDDSESSRSIAGTTARGGGGQLPVTGAELLLIALMGAITLAGGLALRRAAGRWEGNGAA